MKYINTTRNRRNEITIEGEVRSLPKNLYSVFIELCLYPKKLKIPYSAIGQDSGRTRTNKFYPLWCISAACIGIAT